MDRKRKKFFKVFSSRLFLFLLIIATAGLAKITVEKYLEVSKLKATLQKEEEKVKEDENRLKKLEETIKSFEDKEYLERIVRKKLNLIKPGERVIYVIPEKAKEQKSQENREEKKKDKNIFEKIKEFLRIKN